MLFRCLRVHPSFNVKFHLTMKKGEVGKDGKKLLEQMVTLQIPSGSNTERLRVISDLTLPGAEALPHTRQKWLNIRPGTWRVTCHIKMKLGRAQSSPFLPFFIALSS